MLSLSGKICADISEASLREWVEANGTGGYASSTITGMNTRRYHGLLVTPGASLADRYVILSKLEETVVIGGDKYAISSNQYAGNVNPEGHRYLKEFRLSPFPKFVYEIENYRIEKTVFMMHGINAVAVKYLVFPDQGDVEIHLRPLLAYRHFHTLRTDTAPMLSDISIVSKTVRFVPHDGLAPLYMYHNAEVFRERGYWYNNFEYREDLYRGFDCHENLYNPGYLIYTLYRPQQYDAWAVFSTEPLVSIDIDAWKDKEIIRRSQLIKNVGYEQSFLEPLILAADSFIVNRGASPDSAILAGYHWFGEWTRDAMIALPGLTLATGRYQVAKHILHKTAEHLKNGLLPNFFDENNDPVYTAADASLWFIYALYKYLQYTGDYPFARSLLDSLIQIISCYTAGTELGIRMNDISLIETAETSVPVTWMDTHDAASMVRPRTGMIVEINALWYQALRTTAQALSYFGYASDAAQYERQAERAQESFGRVFWSEEHQYLYDFVDGSYRDASLRPNQILSIGLPHNILKQNRFAPVIKNVEEKLLTPLGLRTLSPDDPRFCEHYRGEESRRRHAYHNGTVWPWLFGFFISAVTKQQGKQPDTIACLKQLIAPFREHLRVGGIGSISEIFDGTLPYYFRGCISQAWSVGEILRIYAEDLIPGTPKPILNSQKALTD